MERREVKYMKKKNHLVTAEWHPVKYSCTTVMAAAVWPRSLLQDPGRRSLPNWGGEAADSSQLSLKLACVFGRRELPQPS